MTAEPKGQEEGPASRRDFITVPARARDEIGELAYYIEKVLQSLRQVNEHVRDTSETVPAVLHNLRDIVKMTESATFRVLEETEALIEDAKAATRLIEEARQVVRTGEADRADAALVQLGSLLHAGGRRAMSIMAALEFQDLTAQKVGHAFEVLEEVAARLARIQTLVELEAPAGGGPPAAGVPRDGRAEDIGPGSKAGQALADEILLQFRG
jgi:chemotaxis regulatin CheY-phosphate phosphatase CheZ